MEVLMVGMSGSIDYGIRLAKEGNYKEAIKVLDEDICFMHHDLAMSYYALCIAEAEGNYERALSLCMLAVEKEFYNPDIYHNLGRIFMLNGQKSIALRVFKKGLFFDRRHAGLKEEINKVGVRRRPLLTFLPRRNGLNRFLGQVVARLALQGI